MARMALYRAWRSQTFEDVIGQQHITQTLQNSIREGRLSHAYLFNGPRGTGKTSTAKILAKAVNCERGPSPEPCNECDACRRITSGACIDVSEFDAASNRGVEEIRDIRDKVKYAPTEVRYKVYIIDEVHMLTTEAFNALLKTLEEPPEHVLFILATTEPHKVPATILSRCQRFDFRRITPVEQAGRMRRIC
ncbi:MAG TPA: DNA polymerase III subunit gamma/tau, partial [Paenibacillus sp.]|nr:DNA polymerase III subunit gamma/tau [Paenibacillus sp.]